MPNIPTSQEASAPPVVVQLAALLLDGDLWAWITRYRTGEDGAYPPASWPWIADKLAAVTQGRVAVSGEYLRRLYLERELQ